MNPPAQDAGAFTVNDPYRKNAGRNAFPEIIIQQIGHLGRPELVKIEDVGNGDMNRFPSR